MAALSPASAAASAANTRRISTSAAITPRNAYNSFAVQFKPLADRSAVETEYKYLYIDGSQSSATEDSMIALLTESNSQKINIQAYTNINTTFSKLASSGTVKKSVNHLNIENTPITPASIEHIAKTFPNLVSLELANGCTAEICRAISNHLPNLIHCHFNNSEDKTTSDCAFSHNCCSKAFFNEFVKQMKHLKTLSVDMNCNEEDEDLLLAVLSMSSTLINFTSQHTELPTTLKVLDFLQKNREDLSHFTTLNFSEDSETEIATLTDIDWSRFSRLKMLSIPNPSCIAHLSLNNIRFLNITNDTKISNSTETIGNIISKAPKLQQIQGYFSQPEQTIVSTLEERNIGCCFRGEYYEWSPINTSATTLMVSRALLKRISSEKIPQTFLHLKMILLHEDISNSPDTKQILIDLTKRTRKYIIHPMMPLNFALSELDEYKPTIAPFIIRPFTDDSDPFADA